MPDLAGLLRDIHEPGGVSWWPPAAGWWLVLLAACALLVFGLLRWRRSRRRRRLAREARAELDRLYARYREQADPGFFVREASKLLRRLCVTRYGRKTTAGLTGEKWLALLDREMPGQPFSCGPGRVFAVAPYQPAAVQAESDIKALYRLCCKRIETIWS